MPKGVTIDFPLQAYFRINAESMGQFERTLILVDEGANVHYVEGCTAPMYSTESLHSAVVEVVVKRNARCRYTTIQNWANNIYNLVTKRAYAYGDATMEWVDGNFGSKLTMKYPAVHMMEPGSPRRDPVDCVCQCRTTSGCRCQTGSRRTTHDRSNHQQEHQQERRPQQLSRTRSRRARCARQQEQRCL